MARTMVSKEKALEWIQEVAGEFGNDVVSVRRNLNYYLAGNGEMDDDFSSRSKAIANSMTKKQWEKVLATISDEELEGVLPVEEEAVEETAEAVEEDGEALDVRSACELLQGYLDDQGDGDLTVSPCDTWDEFYEECSKYFDDVEYFIDNYIRVNL